MGRPEYQDVVDDQGHWTGEVHLVEKRLEQPLHWRKPRRVFVCSMNDLFHPAIPSDYLWRSFQIMRRAAQHTFLLLTKRPKEMARLLGGWWLIRSLAHDGRPAILPNIWPGVSVENDDNLWRIDELLKTPAAVRGVSLEPMLGPIDPRVLKGTSWCVLGGESGKNRRPFSKEWALPIRDFCKREGIAFFFKQGSSQYPGRDDLLEGKRYKEFPVASHIVQ